MTCRWEELKDFPQIHSKTPGHPEYSYTPGVETATGPLGQGITNAVGMAIAEVLWQGSSAVTAHPHRRSLYTYVFLGDGCLMEGISHEACSLPAPWASGKRIAFYDDNGISIWRPCRGLVPEHPEALRGLAGTWCATSTATYPQAIKSDSGGALGERQTEHDLLQDRNRCAPNLCGSHDCHSRLGRCRGGGDARNLDLEMRRS